MQQKASHRRHLNAKLPTMKMVLSHILVAQKFEAEDLLRKIQEGVAFGELARKFSTCPSAARDGSLGHIELKRLVAEFAEAAEKLQIGDISGIVKTKFGFHLIRRDVEPAAGHN